MPEITQQAELNLDELLRQISNYVFLIGYMDSLLYKLTRNLFDNCEEKKQYEWINSAIENMIYRNIPAPPMP